MSELKYVFEPIQVNSLVIENRISMPSMHLNFTPDGKINEDFIAFYKERAKGGVGLIIIGGCSINDTAGGHYLIGLDKDDFLEGLKRFTSEIHKVSETKVAAQLYHAGRYAFSMFIGKQPVAPSPIASKLTKEVPKELTVEEIKQIENDFAEAAYRAKRAGFDAVEILGSAGYLIPQFLSPLTNKRNDEYGGDLYNRARFGVEVIKKVREAVGDEFPIIFRQGGSDFMRGGNSSLEILEAVKIFSEAGIDLINVTGGWHETHVPQIASVVPRAGFAYLSAWIRKKTNKPTIVSNRISTITLAEDLIKNGWGDMVNLGRPLIADPYLVSKAKSGDLESIRPCISCNQLCFDAVFTGKKVGCTVNPVVGFESKFTTEQIKKAEYSKKIVIIGAGPAGMSAALVAAQKGHKVVVFEKNSEVGGQLHVASAPSDKKEFASLIDYYKHEANRLNIKIVSGAEPKIEDIKAENPDEVILATGALPVIPDIDGIGKSNVFKAEDILKGNVALGERIVIVGGGAVGVDVALYLLDKSRINSEQASFLLKWEAESCDRVKDLLSVGFKEITIIEMLSDIGRDIGKTTRWIVLKELVRSNVKMVTNTKVEKIEDDGVIVTGENGKRYKIEADTIVIAVGYKSNPVLQEELKKTFGDKLHVIGDASKVAKLNDAIHAGFKVGTNL